MHHGYSQNIDEAQTRYTVTAHAQVIWKMMHNSSAKPGTTPHTCWVYKYEWIVLLIYIKNDNDMLKIPQFSIKRTKSIPWEVCCAGEETALAGGQVRKYRSRQVLGRRPALLRASIWRSAWPAGDGAHARAAKKRFEIISHLIYSGLQTVVPNHHIDKGKFTMYGGRDKNTK